MKVRTERSETRFRRPDPREERGFSLVELMLVVAIIGLLITVATPSYIGAADRARDTNAETDLRQALLAAHTYHAEIGSFDGFDPDVGEQLQPSLSWTGSGEPAVGSVAIVSVSAEAVHLVAKSSSGSFFCLHDEVSAGTPSGTTFGLGPSYVAVDDAGECVAQSW